VQSLLRNLEKKKGFQASLSLSDDLCFVTNLCETLNVSLSFVSRMEKSLQKSFVIKFYSFPILIKILTAYKNKVEILLFITNYIKNQNKIHITYFKNQYIYFFCPVVNSWL